MPIEANDLAQTLVMVQLARQARLNESTVHAIAKTGEFHVNDRKASAAWRAAIEEGKQLYGDAQATAKPAPAGTEVEASSTPVGELSSTSSQTADQLCLAIPGFE